MLFILIILLSYCLSACDSELIIKQKILLGKDDKHTTPVNSSDIFNLTMVSKYGNPFSTTIYSREGKKYVFKGVDVNYQGDISYIEIRNIANNDNKIKIYYGTVSHDDVDYLITAVTFSTLLSMILTGSNSRMTRLLLVGILVLEVYSSYNSNNITMVGERIRKNILKIK